MAHNLTNGNSIHTNHSPSQYLNPAMLSLETEERPSNATTTPSIMNPLPVARKCGDPLVTYPVEPVYSNGECEYEPIVFKEGYEFNSTAEERAPIIAEGRLRSSQSCNASMNSRPVMQNEYNSAAFRSSSHPFNEDYPLQVHKKRQTGRGYPFYQQVSCDAGNYPNASRLPFPSRSNQQVYRPSLPLDSRETLESPFIPRASQWKEFHLHIVSLRCRPESTVSVR